MRYVAEFFQQIWNFKKKYGLFSLFSALFFIALIIVWLTVMNADQFIELFWFMVALFIGYKFRRELGRAALKVIKYSLYMLVVPAVLLVLYGLYTVVSGISDRYGALGVLLAIAALVIIFKD